jgi:tetratricopeptide (TPR) repeat protein
METKRMIGKLNFLYLTIGWFITMPALRGQDLDQDIQMDENAGISLEVYSDEFQECFFEALKQKGIENYDKAIALLLECKKLDPSNHVIDHELAKAFFEDKQYPIAEDYAMVAFLAEPGNIWFLDTVVAIMEKQGGSSDSMLGRLPKGDLKALENLALIYYQKGDFENSLQALKLLKQSRFTEDLLTKINDSLKQNKAALNEKEDFDPSKAAEVGDPLERYKIKIEELIGANRPLELERFSAEALEQYPSQPFLYYAQGLALNRLTRHAEAVEMLETGLDYLLANDTLANKIYKELADAYTAMDNTVKANMYLRMIKPGF